MAYVKTERTKKGPTHVFRCPDEGCHLKDRTGVLYCKDKLMWKKLYDTRQSVERVFKGMKQSRRLNDHCFRGLEKVALHCILSALAFKVTALRNLRTRDAPSIRWTMLRVA